jgi:hypothetical protein
VDFVHGEPAPLGELHRGEIEVLGLISCLHFMGLAKLVN